VSRSELPVVCQRFKALSGGYHHLSRTDITLQHSNATDCHRFYSPYSHSIILADDNALIFQRKFFLRIVKNRIGDPSEIRALDFKEEIPRFAICSASATIDVDWTIFGNRRSSRAYTHAAGKYRQHQQFATRNRVSMRVGTVRPPPLTIRKNQEGRKASFLSWSKRERKSLRIDEVLALL